MTKRRRNGSGDVCDIGGLIDRAAERFGHRVSRQRALEWVRDGLPTRGKGDNGRWLVDADEALDWLAEHWTPNPLKRRGGAADREAAEDRATLRGLDKRLKAERARGLRIENDAAEAGLVRADDARAALARARRGIERHLHDFAERTADRLIETFNVDGDAADRIRAAMTREVESIAKPLRDSELNTGKPGRDGAAEVHLQRKGRALGRSAR